MTPRANAKRRKTTAIVRAQTQALGMVLLRMVVQTRSAKYAKDSQCSGGGTPDLFLKDLPSPNHRKQSRLAGLTLLAWDQDHDENNGHAERKPPLDDIFRWHITHSVHLYQYGMVLMLHYIWPSDCRTKNDVEGSDWCTLHVLCSHIQVGVRFGFLATATIILQPSYFFDGSIIAQPYHTI